MESAARELMVMARELVARKAIELVKIRGDMFEKEDKFMIRFQGDDWGKLYFNMRGYVAERGIPVPRSDTDSKPIGLEIGEKGLSAFKREISKANREWAVIERGRTSQEMVAGRTVYKWKTIRSIMRVLSQKRYTTEKAAGEVADFLIKQTKKMKLKDFQRARSKVVQDEQDLDEAKDDLKKSIVPMFLDAEKKDNYSTFKYAMNSLMEWAKQYGVVI